MAQHLDSDAVQYACTCGRLARINKLFFCRHCLILRCGRCACTQVDSFFCSSCLENIPSAEAKYASNRCTKCYDCPSCQHTLTSRAAKPTIAGDAAAAGDQKDGTPPATAAAAAAASKRKVYYLMCSACRWTSRDVGIPDRSAATGQWPDAEYAHATRFAALLEHGRNVVLHDKQAVQDYARRKTPGQQKFASLTDRTGLTVAIARRTLGWSDTKAAPKRVSRPVAIAAAIPVAQPHPLHPDLLHKPLNLAGITTLRQRLHLPATQPHTVDGLHPAHKSLSIKRSVRCQCEHYVMKPEFNPTSIKFRIESVAGAHVPVVRLLQRQQPLRAGATCAVRVKFINPTAHTMQIVLRQLPEAEEATKAEVATVLLQLPDAAFEVQRRDDSTEFDADTTLPDEPAFVLWRRSNAVVVELRVRAPMEALPGTAVRVGFCMAYSYASAARVYGTATGATGAEAVGAGGGGQGAWAVGAGGGSVGGGGEQQQKQQRASLETNVYLEVGQVQ